MPREICPYARRLDPHKMGTDSMCPIFGRFSLETNRTNLDPIVISADGLRTCDALDYFKAKDCSGLGDPTSLCSYVESLNTLNKILDRFSNLP